MRALQEKEKLLRQMADSAIAAGYAQAAAEHLEGAGRAQRDGEVLRRVLTTDRQAQAGGQPDRVE